MPILEIGSCKNSAKSSSHLTVYLHVLLYEFWVASRGAFGDMNSLGRLTVSDSDAV